MRLGKHYPFFLTCSGIRARQETHAPPGELASREGAPDQGPEFESGRHKGEFLEFARADTEPLACVVAETGEAQAFPATKSLEATGKPPGCRAL